jgi:hypothetical protein
MGLKKAQQFESVLFILDQRGFITSFAIGRSKSLAHFRDIMVEVHQRSPNLKLLMTGN